jgi:erythromycin esterase-like protein
VGFSTYSGTVTAASDWNAPAERKRVRSALTGSYEELFHAVDVPRFLLLPQGDEMAVDLRGPRLERAIGVIYRPETERLSHYFHAQLREQFEPRKALEHAAGATTEITSSQPEVIKAWKPLGLG